MRKNYKMPKLTLPPYPVRLREHDGRLDIFDMLRDRYVALTPEEWVRQHFVNYLIIVKGYPKSLLANEVSLKLNDMSRRCDTVLYDRSLNARMIIEYKRPDVVVSQKVFDQICRYNIVMRVDYLIVSNGLHHYCCKVDYENQSYEFLEDVPDYNQMNNEK